MLICISVGDLNILTGTCFCWSTRQTRCCVWWRRVCSRRRTSMAIWGWREPVRFHCKLWDWRRWRRLTRWEGLAPRGGVCGRWDSGGICTGWSRGLVAVWWALMAERRSRIRMSYWFYDLDHICCFFLGRGYVNTDSLCVYLHTLIKNDRFSLLGLFIKA